VTILDNGVLHLSKIGDVAVEWSRPIEGTIKTVTLVRDAGVWYVCFSCDEVSCQPRTPTGQAVGVDLGLKVFLMTDQGDFVENPRYYRKAQKRLKKRQQEVARRPKQPDRKNGANRKQSILKLQRAHQDVVRQRTDMHHKTARWLVDTYDIICVEKLRVAAMARNRRLSKSIYDAAWAGFLTILTFKAESAGVLVVRVPAAYTTQTCSNLLPNGQRCGTRVKKSLSVRTHICPSCGYIADRDHNAAGTIKQEGLRTVGRTGTG
jgi:putative transposase